jgi:hypothetical protein
MKLLSDRYFRTPQIYKFIKILPVRAELFHAEKQTDMTQLMVTFCNFGDVPKKRILQVLTQTCQKEI